MSKKEITTQINSAEMTMQPIFDDIFSFINVDEDLSTLSVAELDAYEKKVNTALHKVEHLYDLIRVPKKVLENLKTRVDAVRQLGIPVEETIVDERDGSATKYCAFDTTNVTYDRDGLADAVGLTIESSCDPNAPKIFSKPSSRILPRNVDAAINQGHNEFIPFRHESTVRQYAFEFMRPSKKDDDKGDE